MATKVGPVISRRRPPGDVHDAINREMGAAAHRRKSASFLRWFVRLLHHQRATLPPPCHKNELDGIALNVCCVYTVDRRRSCTSQSTRMGFLYRRTRFLPFFLLPPPRALYYSFLPSSTLLFHLLLEKSSLSVYISLLTGFKLQLQVVIAKVSIVLVIGTGTGTGNSGGTGISTNIGTDTGNQKGYIKAIQCCKQPNLWRYLLLIVG